MTQEPSESFGDLLRDFRLAAGLSQETLAERARMSLGGISVLERGVRRSPHRETIALLADGLKLSTEDRARLEAAAWQPPAPRRRKSIGRQAFPSGNLPMELTSFVGRTMEVCAITGYLQARSIVTLSGTGGVGKTRTALHAARSRLADGEETVWFVDLSTISGPATSVADAIAATVGLEGSPKRPAIETLISYFTRNSALLVLDNCEHVNADVASVVRALIRAGVPVRILATSREPLKVEGEQVYRLPPLPESDAIELFAQRAGAVDHRFTLTDENRSIVSRICERLDGIPLAIELAAARIGVLPLKALNDKLDRRLAVLKNANQSGSPRQWTMRALIDWSYDLLPAREQRIFEQLSVFAGGCTLDAAIAVSGEDGFAEQEIFDGLASLVDKSLVVTAVNVDEPRFTLLESIREYAREKLMAGGNFWQTARRHALAYYDLASQLEESYSTPFPMNAALEIENWRAALGWALASSGDPQLGMRLASVLRRVWARLAPREGRYWLATAFQHVDDRTPLPILAKLEYCEANLALRFAESSRALDFGTRALEHFGVLGETRAAAQAQRVMGHALTSQGRIDEAKPLLSAALETARRTGFGLLAAAALESLGLAHSYNSEFDDALRCFSEAILIYKDIGDCAAIASASANLAEMKFIAGDAQGAVAAVQVEESSPHTRVQASANLSAYLIALSRYDEARSAALDALQLARQLGVSAAVAWALQHLAAIALLRPCDGEREGRRTLDVIRLLGFVDSQLASLGAPRQYTEQQEYDRAINVLRAEVDSAGISAMMAAGAIMTEDQAVALANSLS